jgi:hypothetical protein
MEFELRTLHLLGRSFTTWAKLPAPKDWFKNRIGEVIGGFKQENDLIRFTF